MKIRILGPRVLVKNYTLPEKIGSIFVPDYTLTQHDGKTYECVQASDEVQKHLAIGMVSGNDVFPVLNEGLAGLDPLVLEPDDILLMRYQWRGVWAGPEIRRHLGYDAWFINVVEERNVGGKLRPTPAIAKVIPARTWKDNEEAA